MLKRDLFGVAGLVSYILDMNILSEDNAEH